jgi:thymidylate synthase
VFGRSVRFDLRRGFPAVTTKKLAWRACKGELLWFIEGSGDERRLAEITHGETGGVTIWTPNAYAPYWRDKAKFHGDLGRVYGVQWRKWNKYTLKRSIDTVEHENNVVTHFDAKLTTEPVDQLANLIEGLKRDPNGRRHILNAWNVGELEEMALPPCHVMSQFYVNKNKELSCHMYQRSVDVFLGLPFNIASYALLTHMIAQVCNLKVGELIISMGDTHIYQTHLEQVKEQLQREPIALPTLFLTHTIKDIDKFTMNDIQLENYKSHDQIYAKMAV